MSAVATETLAASDTLVACYERLRPGAPEPRPGAERRGLALLMRQGMAAWIEAWLCCSAPCAPTLGETTDTHLPAPVQAELVQVLAGMTWDRLREAYA